MAESWTPQIFHVASEAGYWASQSKIFGSLDRSIVDANFGVSVASCIAGRTSPAGVRADDMVQIDLAFAEAVGATPACQELDGNSMPEAETDLTTFLTSLSSKMSADFTWNRIRWHNYTGTNTKPGPAVRDTAISIVGSLSSQRLPDQDSGTITFQTASRRHWGRVYVPGLTTSDLSTYGLLHSSFFCDAVAGYMDTLINAVEANAHPSVLGVFSRTYHGFLTVVKMDVDNVPDVQRRRRANAASYRKTYTS